MDPRTCSPDLIEHYKTSMEGGKNYLGLTTLRHERELGQLIASLGCKTLLDYGCGRGDQYKPPHLLHKRWGIDSPRLYDPSCKDHSDKPGQEERFDAVLCVDVLEHVEERHIDAVLDELSSWANKLLFLSVSTRTASKCFPDGRNVHVTVKDHKWWKERIAKRKREGLSIRTVWN
jgi:hypothetical protein